MTRFDHFVEEALYGQHGFYSTGQRAGSEGADFITSPETSTLFGACVAEYLDRLWQQLERPNPFVVIEAGSGPGTLCRDIFMSVQECSDAIRYVMVERSDSQRETAFREVTTRCFIDQQEVPLAVLQDLPAGSFTGVVLANELLDNLPPRVVKKTTKGWLELHVEQGAQVWQAAPSEAATMASRGDTSMYTSASPPGISKCSWMDLTKCTRCRTSRTARGAAWRPTSCSTAHPSRSSIGRLKRHGQTGRF